MQGLKLFWNGDGWKLPVSDAWVTASAVWRLRICLVRGVLGTGVHHIARDPVMGIIIPMNPAIEGTGSGRWEDGDVRVRVRGWRHTVRRVFPGHPSYWQWLPAVSGKDGSLSTFFPEWLRPLVSNKLSHNCLFRDDGTMALTCVMCLSYVVSLCLSLWVHNLTFGYV